MTNINYRTLIGSSLLILTFSGISYLFIWDILNRPVSLSDNLELDSKDRYLLSIEKGSNLKRVNTELRSH